MLKADMQARLDELEPMVEQLEDANEKLAARVEKLSRERDALKQERNELRTALERAQATLDTAQLSPPHRPAETRDYLLQLLIDLGHAAEASPEAARALTGARNEIARSLRGRWPDESDPNPERLARVREIMDPARWGG